MALMETAASTAQMIQQKDCKYVIELHELSVSGQCPGDSHRDGY